MTADPILTIELKQTDPKKRGQAYGEAARERIHSILDKYREIFRHFTGETWETIGETIALIHDIKPLSTIFYILDLFPGTELYERLRDNSVIMDDVWLDRIEGIMYYLLDPDLSDAACSLAGTLATLDRMPEALQVLAAYCARHPGDTVAAQLAAEIRAAAGR